MKRVKGFTLAEVLITLGIIGVVAALTAPALVQNAGNAKIGPTLAKVKTTIENANQQILYDNEASKLSAVVDDSISSEIGYMDLLSQYISGSSYNSTPDFSCEDVLDPEPTDYNGGDDHLLSFLAGNSWGKFKFSPSIDIMVGECAMRTYSSKGSFKGSFTEIVVDINGFTTGPNTQGKDLFAFMVDEGGALIPWGSTTQYWLLSYEYWHWDDGTDKCNDSTVKTGISCAGSIFDNNLKVIYQ